MISKIIKHNKLIAAALILSFLFSLGMPVWSDDAEVADDAVCEECGLAEAACECDEADDIPYDIPLRDEEEVFDKMKKVAETDSLELRVLEEYTYTGRQDVFKESYVHDKDGNLIDYDEDSDMFLNDEGDRVVPMYDENGDAVLDDNGEQRTEFLGFFRREHEDGGAVRLLYNETVSEEAPGKVKEEGIFAVKVKENGYIWWSNPINAAHDPVAKSVHVDNLSSPIVFRAGNPATYSSSNFRSNTVSEVREGTGPANYHFKNNCERIEEINNGARFHYSFPDRSTRIIMEVVLEGDSVLVTIPEDGIKEDKIVEEIGGSVMLTLSLLNSFGAAQKGEEGYIVVPDGSGAVIEFDNNKTNTAQYAGQVYGRDYAVSQKFAPPVNQQVNLPMFGMVRDNGNNALVAVAEKGDENAIIRAAIPGQEQQVTLRGTRNAIANVTSYNLAWFDFTMRTVDSFYIGTEFVELPIYEQGEIKTGDIAVRYYPIAGSNLSYVDVADTYREHLKKHPDFKERELSSDLPMYMTVNGGTVKRQSIMGFPVNLQTEATTYEQAAQMVETVRDRGVSDLVLTFNDFSTSNIKREVSSNIQYSSMLGGKSNFHKLNGFVNNNSFTMYPSLGFMEFHKSGGGYYPLLNSSREVTRSRATQQRFELAFGTPDSLQQTSHILSPYYYEDVFDSLIRSFKSEGINTISLDNATTLLYSDFSRTNQFGSIFYNRKDTVKVLVEGFKKLDENGISIMAQSANAYALPYVSHVSNVPLYSSNYDIFDYDVPLYQMVLKGLIPYTTTAFNASSNLEELTLLALATATPVHYEFIHGNPGDFDNSDYNKKFYASFEGWLDGAIENYQLFNELMGDVANERLVEYRRISNHQFFSRFESGRSVYININTGEFKVEQIDEGGDT